MQKFVRIKEKLLQDICWEKDVFFCSPTGSRKPLKFETAPFVLSYMKDKDWKFIQMELWRKLVITWMYAFCKTRLIEMYWKMKLKKTNLEELQCISPSSIVYKRSHLFWTRFLFSNKSVISHFYVFYGGRNPQIKCIPNERILHTTNFNVVYYMEISCSKNYRLTPSPQIPLTTTTTSNLDPGRSKAALPYWFFLVVYVLFVSLHIIDILLSW